MWIDGAVVIKDLEANKLVNVIFEADVSYGLSQKAICNGHILELRMKIDDEVVCRYDRGWAISPICLPAELALRKLLNHYDGRSIEAAIPYEE